MLPIAMKMREILMDGSNNTLRGNVAKENKMRAYL